MLLARSVLSGFSLLAILLASACGPVSKLPDVDAEAAAIEAEKQRELILETEFAQYARVSDIAYALSEKNADLCQDDTAYSIGVILANKHSFDRDFQETVARVYGFGDGANLVTVAEGSPADQAGLEIGDAIVSINGWAVPSGKKAPETTTAKIKELGEEDPTLSLVVDTDEGKQIMDVAAREVCGYQIGVLQDDRVNALADGERIAVTSGMIRFTDDDVELATVIGHEMAHNMMHHIDKQKGNLVLGTLLDILLAGVGVNTQGTFGKLATMVYSKGFEAEADYVGLYLMARAGFEIEEAPDFWRRMAIVHPGSVKSALAASHPPTPERFLALEQTVAEITAKRRAAQPLMPELATPESQAAERPEPPRAFGQ
jgi:hypothetical protein